MDLLSFPFLVFEELFHSHAEGPMHGHVIETSTLEFHLYFIYFKIRLSISASCNYEHDYDDDYDYEYM